MLHRGELMRTRAATDLLNAAKEAVMYVEFCVKKKTNSFSASQKIHHVVCNSDYRVYKSPPFVSALSQSSSVHTIPTDLF